MSSNARISMQVQMANVKSVHQAAFSDIWKTCVEENGLDFLRIVRRWFDNLENVFFVIVVNV